MGETKAADHIGQDVYVGIDVHLNDWKVSIFSNDRHIKTFTQPPEPAVLIRYLRRQFSDASYHCVYEAGFCGFWICRALRQQGVDCIVVSPADVPSTHKEQSQKRDRVDARKLARERMKGDLRAVYVPAPQAEGDRMLMRARFSLVGKQTRVKNQIKGLLRYQGIEIPKQYSRRYWSQSMLTWLEELATWQGEGRAGSHCILSESACKVLRLRLEELDALRQRLAAIHDDISNLAKEPRYRDRVTLLTSIPGIGLLTAMVVLLELVEVERFTSLDQLKSFVGLVPRCHRSGDRGGDGPLTRRRNPHLRNVLIESAWQAVRRDPQVMATYARLKSRMRSQEAIIRIATKQLARIYFVLRRRQPLQPQPEVLAVRPAA